LGSSESSIRISGANNLGDLKDRRAIRPLLETLKDGDGMVVLSAIKALEKIGEPRVLDDIKKAKKKLLIKFKKTRFVPESLINESSKKYKVAKDKKTEEQVLKESDLNKYEKYLSGIDDTISILKKIKFEQMAQITEQGLREMNWQNFQDKIIETLDGIPSDKKVADMGIDGMASSGVPIQVKQSENVGRNVIDNFETALRRYYPASKKIKKGIIVAFSFTKGAYDEAQRAHLEDKIKIDLVTVEELIE